MDATPAALREFETRKVADTAASARSRAGDGAGFEARQRTRQLRAGYVPVRHRVPRAAQVFVMDVRPGMAEFAKAVLARAGLVASAFDDPTVAGHAFAFASPLPRLLMVHNSIASWLGWELVRACRRIHPRVRVVVMRDDPVGSSQPDSIPADTVLHQPYDDDLLLQEARRLCAA